MRRGFAGNEIHLSRRAIPKGISAWGATMSAAPEIPMAARRRQRIPATLRGEIRDHCPIGGHAAGLRTARVAISSYGSRRKTIGATAGSSGTFRLSMSPSSVLMSCTVLFPGHAAGSATRSKTSVWRCSIGRPRPRQRNLSPSVIIRTVPAGWAYSWAYLPGPCRSVSCPRSLSASAYP